TRLVSPNTRHLYYSDESENFAEKNVSQVVIDLLTFQSRFLYSGDYTVTTRDKFAISPSGEEMVLDSGKTFSLVSIESNRVVKIVTVPKSDTIEFDVDWNKRFLSAIWTSYEEMTWQFHRLLVDMKTGTGQSLPIAPPRGNETLDYRTPTNRLLLAYGQGLGKTGITLPALTPVAKKIIEKYTETFQSQVPFDPRTAYFSPDARFIVTEHLVATSVAIQKEQETKYRSEVIILDMEDPKAVKRFKFDHVLVTVLFGYQD
ncbi:MAG TPA: hypothetical protein PLJ47_06075, partial [Candidatus Hydrogenedentes bacterium]|nr:hypothetical protein [Candidatus Hydrogenedentota bacterium]